MKYRFWGLIMTTLLTINCYDVKQDKDGRTIKINRLTGQTFIIEGDKLIKVKDESDIIAAANRTLEAHDWGNSNVSVAGGFNTSLSTKWVGGKMLYIFKTDRNLRDKFNSASLLIHLYDGDNFRICQIEVPVYGMTGIVGNGTTDILSMTYQGEYDLSEKQYLEISHWDCGWRGFD